MCILLLSTSHPKYPLILLSNRDEYLNRPTAPADFWQAPNDDVLGPRDLAREDHGSWIGITRTGRLAILLNYRETRTDDTISPLSRGILVKNFLTSRCPSTQQWIKTAIENAGPGGLSSVGGFSMVCGILRRNHLNDTKNGCGQSADHPQEDITDAMENERLETFAVLTNRSTSSVDGTSWLFSPTDSINPTVELEYTESTMASVRAHTYGISNSLYTHPWPKVHRGCDLLASSITNDILTQTSEFDNDAFIESLFRILLLDEMPRDVLASPNPNVVFDALRHTIFVPVFKATNDLLRDTDSSISPVVTDVAKPDGSNDYAISQTPSSNVDGPPISSTISDPRTKPYTFVKGKYYGTRTQTVILVSNEGRVQYIERTLHERDDMEHKNEESKTRTFVFDILGWDE
ncbi:NRDE protein-domain-containing protein [Lipomyces orientalis]|uniref:NRDE protein-domain-containing protein n=1 Tax=Lipomyces orientalis TaxID=1233043 RepID=A0ACC3TQQ3_9ASCO